MTMSKDGGVWIPSKAIKTRAVNKDIKQKEEAIEAYRQCCPNIKVVPQGTSPTQDAFVQGYIKVLRDGETNGHDRRYR